VLDTIQGRLEDTLSLPSFSGGRVAVPPLVFNRIMDILPLGGWQVILERDDGLTVLLTQVRGDLADDILEGQLQRALAEQGACVPRIEIQRVAEIPKAASGKTPQIRQSRRQPAVATEALAHAAPAA
jgi:phenylacetate-coenzyme A ligase PaaK-like adenylate-forming protein